MCVYVLSYSEEMVHNIYIYKKMYICHTQYFEKIIYNHKYRFMSSEIKFVHQLRISNVGISRLSPPVANFIILINNMITCVYIDMCIAKMCTLCSYYFPQAYRSSNIETQDFNLYFLHVMLFVIENKKTDPQDRIRLEVWQINHGYKICMAYCAYLHI